MTIGTKTLLFGVHSIFIHPFFVFWAWKKIYGWPKSFPLYVAFFVHDLGYWGKPNLDGEEGESHPVLGARIMNRLFGVEWARFTICHSRYFADRLGENVSQLCVADKLASVIYPRWLYIRLSQATGEILEYRKFKVARTYGQVITNEFTSDEDWFEQLKSYMIEYVENTKHLADPPPS